MCCQSVAVCYGWYLVAVNANVTIVVAVIVVVVLCHCSDKISTDNKRIRHDAFVGREGSDIEEEWNGIEIKFYSMEIV